MYKRLYYTGIAGYVVMLIFSVLFYKERTIISDTSTALFVMFKNGGYSVQLSRLCAVFTQSFPLIAFKAGLSLTTAMTSYSSAFVIYYFFCYLTCGSLLKRYDLALLILLLNILFVSDSFFWIISELPQGIAFFILMLAVANDKLFACNKTLAVSVVVFSSILLTLFHPLIFFILAYSSGFFFISKERFKISTLYLIVAVFIAATIIRSLAFTTDYDRHSMGNLKNFIRFFPDYFTLYSNKLFLDNCVTKYYWIPIVLVSIIIVYGNARKWKQLMFFLFAFFGYLMLVNISYPTSATPLFYIENLYLPLGFILALPFVFDVLPVLDKKKLALPVIAMIILTGSMRIYTAHNPYTTRLDYERTILDKYEGQKVIVKASPKDLDVLQMLWSNPYEFLLLSACERNKPASILIDENPERLGWAREKKKELIVNSDIVPYTSLPDRYFKFTDTVNGYQVITQNP